MMIDKNMAETKFVLQKLADSNNSYNNMTNFIWMNTFGYWLYIQNIHNIHVYFHLSMGLAKHFVSFEFRSEQIYVLSFCAYTRKTFFSLCFSNLSRFPL